MAARDALAAVARRRPDVDQVRVADTVGEQPGHPDDAVAVMGEDDVLRLGERPPQGLGRAAVVEVVGVQVGLRRAQSTPSSEESSAHRHGERPAATRRARRCRACRGRSGSGCCASGTAARAGAAAGAPGPRLGLASGRLRCGRRSPAPSGRAARRAATGATRPAPAASRPRRATAGGSAAAPAARDQPDAARGRDRGDDGGTQLERHQRRGRRRRGTDAERRSAAGTGRAGRGRGRAPAGRRRRPRGAARRAVEPGPADARGVASRAWPRAARSRRRPTAAVAVATTALRWSASTRLTTRSDTSRRRRDLRPAPAGGVEHQHRPRPLGQRCERLRERPQRAAALVLLGRAGLVARRRAAARTSRRRAARSSARRRTAVAA